MSGAQRRSSLPEEIMAATVGDLMLERASPPPPMPRRSGCR
jgi:hypothetical protein